MQSLSKRKTTTFSSFAALIRDMEYDVSMLHFRLPLSNAPLLETLVKTMERSLKSLKWYLFSLGREPTARKVGQKDVREAFDAIYQTWETIPPDERPERMATYHILRYCQSVDALLSSEEAVKAARTSLSLTASTFIDEDDL